MNIIVLHPQLAIESAQKLARHIGGLAQNPFEAKRKAYGGFDVVFNYGCNRNIKVEPGAQLINSAKAVAMCRDKIATLKVFHDQKIPAINYVTKREDVPKNWETVVGREVIDGKENQGMKYFYRKKGKLEPLPDWPLFTEFFDHAVELRVVVFKGKVVGRYKKFRNKFNRWQFIEVKAEGFRQIDKDAILAAGALGIDYVGFDILCKDNVDYRFIEANSAPVLLDSVLKTLMKVFK